jgi:hypothetical protein
MRQAVLTDDQRDIGVPMLLHTAASLSAGAAFGTADYLRQALLGRRLLETGDLGGEETDARLLCLNFHAVPAASRRRSEERIRRVLDLGEPFDPDTDGTGPGLRVMLAFYDGDRDTGLFAADFCGRLGVRAYFYPVEHTGLESGVRLTDDDLAGIAEEHELCFHTASHRSAVEITPANQQAEVVGPLERLTRLAGRGPRIAAWRGGGRFDPTELGNRLVRDLGVAHLVTNWTLEPVS